MYAHPVYAHPILPLHDHAPSFIAYQLGRDATRAAFCLLNRNDFESAAAEFRRAAAAAEVIAANLHERAHQHKAGSAECRLLVERCHRWADIAVVRGEYATQCQALAELADALAAVAS